VHIVIVGGGLVGSTVAGKLAQDGHDVTLVEADPSKLQELTGELDIQSVQGNGATATVLRQAGAKQADLVVATTNSDEANMTVGLLATSLFRVPRVVVRLRDPNHAEGFKLIGQHDPGNCVAVNPEAAAVDRIFSLLSVPGAVDVMSFLKGRLVLAGFRVTPASDFVGLSLSHMRLLFPATPTLVTAIRRGDEWIVPHGNEEIQTGDLVYFAIAREEVGDVVSLIGSAPAARRQVMIAGAGRIGLALAKRLEEAGIKAVLIEDDPQRAKEAEEALEKTLVIRGTVTERSLLEEEEIERVSAFVAVTADHEVNLVSSLLATRLGAHRAFALVDNPALATLIGDIGIDAVISPRLLAVGLLLQHIRRGRVRAAAALVEDKVEVMEVEAESGSRLTAEPLSKVGLPAGMIVAAIQRGTDLLVPTGEDRVEAGDRVLIVTTTQQAGQLDAFLSRP
jgi:trk system potassium uptake protein TrkA